MSTGVHSYYSISYDAARKLLAGILNDAAGDGGKPVAVAVVDDRGDLVAFGRLDGTPVRSVTIAINKAYTSSRTRQSTAALAATLARANRGADVYTDPRITLFPGGTPLLTAQGTVVGAIGISGRLPDEDDALASRWNEHISLEE